MAITQFDYAEDVNTCETTVAPAAIAGVAKHLGIALRMLLAVAIATGTVAGVMAAERATFVLTDGSRHSGEVVFHGSGNRNIIDNFLNLGEGGQEKTFPVDQVAIIDFAGGQPTAAEFQQLPADNGDLLVLRGGGTHRGKLVNLINGDTLLWQNEAGEAQQYAIRDVARVYLNPQAARRIYPQYASVAPATGAVVNTPVPQGAIQVLANQQWVTTGVGVRKGQRVAFSATGQIQFSPDSAHVAGPDGNPAVQTPGMPVAAMAAGGLIGRVGNSQPFPIGSNRQPIVMPATGALELGVNDTIVGDNAGWFVVTLTVSR